MRLDRRWPALLAVIATQPSVRTQQAGRIYFVVCCRRTHLDVDIARGLEGDGSGQMQTHGRGVLAMLITT